MASLLLISLLAAAGLAYYIRMAVRLPAYTAPKVDFGLPDAALAGLFGIWILFRIATSFGQHVEVNSQMLASNIVFSFFLIAIIVGWLVGRDRNPVVLFGLRWKGWRRGIFFALGSLLAVYPLIFLPLAIIRMSGMEVESQDVVQFLLNAKSLQDRLLLVVMAVVAAPLAEEIIFRGYIHGVLRKFSGRWVGLVLNSLLFAGSHGHLPTLASLFFLAVALTLVYERTGSLWAPVLMHATFNALTVLAAFLWPDLPS